MAAILHDVGEDTNIGLEDLEKLFGKKVSEHLVDPIFISMLHRSA